MTDFICGDCGHSEGAAFAHCPNCNAMNIAVRDAEGELKLLREIEALCRALVEGVQLDMGSYPDPIRNSLMAAVTPIRSRLRTLARLRNIKEWQQLREGEYVEVKISSPGSTMHGQIVRGLIVHIHQGVTRIIGLAGESFSLLSDRDELLRHGLDPFTD